MYPVLFHIGPLPVSSFGFFLALALLAAIFVVWRVAKSFDVNEEKVLDLAILVFFAGILGARLGFVILNWNSLTEINQIFLINRYPGLSLWGGLLGGTAALWFFSKRAKLNFWQIADFAAIGLLLGISLGNVGCLLGGCNLGIISNSFLAVPVAGLLGKRLPLSVFEGLFLFLVFLRLWPQTVRFHFAGKILALVLINLGLIKFILEFYRMERWHIFQLGPFVPGHLVAILLFFFGVCTFYRQSKRSIMLDLKVVAEVITSAKKRQLVFGQLSKVIYNYKVGWRVALGKMVRLFADLPKFLKRRLNVKSTPRDIN